MPDLERQVQEAGRHIDVEWDDMIAATALGRFRRRQRRRVVARVTVAMAVAAGVALWVWLPAGQRPSDEAGNVSPLALETPGAEPSGPAPSEQDEDVPSLLRFEDGSLVLGLGEHTRLSVLEQSPARIAIALEEGSAVLDIRHAPERAFEVHSGAVVVTVVGTAFTVTRETSRTGVQVQRGHVSVAWPGGTRDLYAGDSGWFAHAAAEPRSDPRPRAAREHQSWQALADRGDFDEAYRAIQRGHVRDRVEELLSAADVARRSGHPAEALPRLQRVIDAHGGDSRAPLAAFTMGRILLERLSRPRQAAAAFARARQGNGSRPLAEDALAREVQAWHQAGEATHARTAAELYVRRYPDGARIYAVRRYGGVE